MSRKWLDGPQRYSLGALCDFLGIDNEAHHRAWGDATATAELFSILWRDHSADMEAESGRGGGTPGGPAPATRCPGGHSRHTGRLPLPRR